MWAWASTLITLLFIVYLTVVGDWAVNSWPKTVITFAIVVALIGFTLYKGFQEAMK